MCPGHKKVSIKSRSAPADLQTHGFSAVLPLFLLTLNYTLFSVKVEKQLRIYPSSHPCTTAASQTEPAQKKHSFPSSADQRSRAAAALSPGV